MSHFLTFQQFATEDDANEVAEKLKEHGIDIIIESNPPLLDSNFIGTQYNNYVLLKIDADDFEKAQKILIENTPVDINTVDKHYTLFSFTNNELMDVLKKPDEWGAFNYNLALQILKERGVEISEEKKEELQHEFIDTLSEKKSLSKWLIRLGYFFSLIGIPATIVGGIAGMNLIYNVFMLPGIFGIIIGWQVARSKKTLP